MAELLAANQITIAKVLDGEKGETGADGKTSYFHIKYSAVANPTSSLEMSETPLAYIGTYVDFTEADSTDPTKYTWSRFEGIQGEKGEQGIPGIGTDGKTSYLHIAYAMSADGSEGFSISESANKAYIGQYTDFVASDSTDYTKYSWTKIKGEMSAEQLAQLNQASEDAANAQTDINTLLDKTRSGHIETLSGSGFVQSTKTEDGGTTEVVVYGKSNQKVTQQSANLCPTYDKWTLSGGAYIDGDYIVFPSNGATAVVDVHWKKASNIAYFHINCKRDGDDAASLIIGADNGNGWSIGLQTDETTYNHSFGGNNVYGDTLLKMEYVRFTLNHYQTATGSMRIKNFMVSSTDTPYVPFVPDSPSPEYPSEIQSVENPNVTACGTNVFDAEAFYQHYYALKQDIYKVTVDGVECLKFRGESGYESDKFHRFPLKLKPNTQYLISFRGKKDSVYGHNSTGISVNYLDGISSHLICTDTTTFTDVGMISRADKTITSLNIYYAYGEYCYLDINSICIREVGTEVEPYKGKTATLSGIVLMSIPDGTRDKLFKDTDGLWKVDRKCGVVDLGKLTWTYVSTGTRFNAELPQIKTVDSNTTKTNILCSSYVAGSPNDTWNTKDKVISANTDSHLILVRDTAYTNAIAFKSAMSGVMAVYELATPTTETLPDSIQAELNALTTYNPITNVMVSDGITPDIDVSFWTRDYYAKNAAENAAKVATNFMGYDSTNGLIIGNKTSGSWSGYRSQILPGSFNVLDASSTVLASFGPTTIIGEEANANMHLTFNNLSMVDKNGTKFFEVGDSRNADGIATLQWSSPDVPIGTSGSTTIRVENTISSIVSVSVDSVELSSSSYSFSGDEVTINNLAASSEKYIEIIYKTTDPAYYLTFGSRRQSAIIGERSIAEGRNVTASGFASHAEGVGTSAIGAYSHAEGHSTKAKAAYSHAVGYQTVADSSYMTAIGKYNTENSGKAFVVGVGDFISRRDGFTVDWDGNVAVKGNLVVQGDNLVDKIQNMFCTSYPETLTVTAGTFTNNRCSATLVGNNLQLFVSAKAKAAITAGNITNQTMLTITFVDNKIGTLYSVSGSGGASGPNSQIYFDTSSSGGQHTITVTLAAIAQNLASGGIIDAYVSIPCRLKWDAY